MTTGGTPFLDNKYTVFGEVVDNLKLIDDIATVQKDEADRPVEDIKMSMTVKKLRKKKITKLYGYKYPKKK
jgi:peptidyl-prolyl cis-trans isomerase B (cyclophilin B)